ncbi:Canalicular multispecific organic anion transporter 2 [Desmophyllum pertusum]|uniref:Canalicular multispecific organic anion transporter 2 n=1 Tax=Desmophyllum pertusum TaxID=174260 RepID=A0A9X0A033_9CNID|nr:Canalicular multispecific organic anion transporter 2 [Desmophyllum pertusum]
MRFPLAFFPDVISSCIQARVSIKRLEEFLDLEELDPDSVQRASPTLLTSGMVSVRNGVFGWNKKDAPKMHGINLNIPKWFTCRSGWSGWMWKIYIAFFSSWRNREITWKYLRRWFCGVCLPAGLDTERNCA